MGVFSGTSRVTDIAISTVAEVDLSYIIIVVVRHMNSITDGDTATATTISIAMILRTRVGVKYVPNLDCQC